MSTWRFTHKAGRVLALTTIFFAAASLTTALDAAYAQHGGPGGGPSGGHGHAGGAPGSGHGHTGGWHGAGRGRHSGWYGPGWNQEFLGGGLAGAATAPSPYSYRYLYDSPYYPDYDSYH